MINELKRSQSADDLLGLALMEEAFHRQAGRKKAAPASPKKGDPAADAGVTSSVAAATTNRYARAGIDLHAALRQATG